MKVGGTFIGTGLGDDSSEVAKIFEFLSRKFRAVRDRNLSGTLFTEAHQAAIAQLQRNYIADGKLRADEVVTGVINYRFKEVSGYLKQPEKPKPIIFTVEGHLSDMFVGPCASTASALEQQGVCRWKPVWYDVSSLPFNNKSGVEALAQQYRSQAIEGPIGPNGAPIMWPFPSGTNSGIVGFSQGAMVASDFVQQHLLAGGLDWRLKDFKRGLMFGNPRRERDAVCWWAQSPPDPGTHGIMDRLFNASKTPVADRWAEHPNDDDMFAEIGDSKADQDKTAIARIITENSWIGGPTAIFSRVLALFGNPVGEGFAAVKASFEAVMFLAKNPNPHYGTFATPGDISWMAGVAA